VQTLTFSLEIRRVRNQFNLFRSICEIARDLEAMIPEMSPEELDYGIKLLQANDYKSLIIFRQKCLAEMIKRREMPKKEKKEKKVKHGKQQRIQDRTSSD
jgi:hypothetical protein